MSDTANAARFEDITTRLDEIVGSVRSKDTSLEKSLELFDEAIALGSKAVELVDDPTFSPEEAARLNGKNASDAPVRADSSSEESRA